MKNRENIYALDSIDKQIVHMLVDNARTSLAIIAQKVGISTTAIHQRIKKLEAAGVIETSVSFLNPAKVGYLVTAFVGIYLENPAKFKDVNKALKGINEVVEVHSITGTYTIFLKALCRDNAHLMEVLMQIQEIKGVSKTETFISLDQSVNRQIMV